MLNKKWLLSLLVLSGILSLPLFTIASPPTQTDTEMLIYGSNVTRRIEGGEIQRFTFSGQQGDVVTIQIQGDFVNTLTLYTADTLKLAQNDNFAPDIIDTRIGNIILPATEIYTLEILNNSQTDEQYTLRLDGGAYAVIPIQFGETLSHTLTDNPVDIWTFSGSAGDTVSLYVDGEFDPYLELYGPSSQLLASTRSARSQVGEILNLTLESTGTFRLAVSYFGDTGGEYTVQLEGISANFWILESGREVEANFVTTAPHQWTFYGTAGEYATIGTTGNLDTVVQLYLGEQYITSDDDLFTHNAYLRDIELPADGTYTVYVWDYTLSLGDYSILMTKSMSPSASTNNQLIYGDAFTAELNDKADTWTFEGTRGDIVTIGTNVNFIASVYLYSPADELLRNQGTYTYTDPYIEVRLPTTGIYRIVIEHRYGTDTAYRIGLLGTSSDTPPLTYGDEINIIATAEKMSQTFELEATAGDILSIQLTGGFDLSLTVYDETGNIITGDSEPFFGIAEITEWIVPETGQYTVLVSYPYYYYPDDPELSEETNKYTLIVTEIPYASIPPTPRPVAEVPTSMPETAVEMTEEEPDETVWLHRYEASTGEITSNDLELWSLAAINGEILFLGLKTDGFTPQVNLYNPPYLYTPSPSLINRIGEYAVAIVNFNIGETGIYQVTANRVSPLETGSYELILLPMHEVATSLAYNTVTAYQPSSEGDKIDHLWYFSGTAEDEVELIFEADTVRYAVYGPYGNLVERVNSTDTMLVLPLDGTYAIWVENPPENYTVQVLSSNPTAIPETIVAPADYEQKIEASFEQVNDVEEPEEVITSTPPVDIPQPIIYGEIVVNTLDLEEINNWEFQGRAGDILTVEVRSNFDTYLEIYDSVGYLHVINDDTNELDAAIIDFTLPEDGVYTIRIRGLGYSAGDYSLWVELNE